LQQVPKSDNRMHVFLYLFILMILIYAVQDFQTSRNTTAVIGAARGGVHVTLFAILTALAGYYSCTVWGAAGLSPVKLCLWSIFGWIGIASALQSSSLWGLAVQWGLSALWILTYHFFSTYVRRFSSAFSQMQVFIAIMFVFYVFSALYASYNIHVYLVQKGQDRLAVVNMVYSVLVFLPWLSLVVGKKKRLAGFILVLLVVLASMKRGAIIVFPLMICTSMLVEAVVRKKELWRPATKIIFSLAFFLAGLLTADHLSNDFLSKRFSSEQLASGSGRSHLYSSALHEIAQRPFTDLLVGRGSGSSMQFIGNAMHNEWLEFLFSYGVIGVVLYAMLLLALASQALKLLKYKSRYAPAYAMSVVYILFVGMFGQIYFAHSTLYIMALYGTIDGLVQNESSINNANVMNVTDITA
jgi:hypothetical protein